MNDSPSGCAPNVAEHGHGRQSAFGTDPAQNPIARHSCESSELGSLDPSPEHPIAIESTHDFDQNDHQNVSFTTNRLCHVDTSGLSAPHVIDEVAYPRFASRGRTYVYVLPCRDEDILKVGFSRDPLDRMRTLHPRFFEFFDLERALLIETDHLRDARRIERLFITTFVDYQAPAPLVVPRAAAGYTEWYRGIYPMVTALARQQCEQSALTLHAPLAAWLRDRFDEWSDRLFDWSARMLDMIEYERFNVPSQQQTHRVDNALCHVLDAYVAMGLSVQPLVPHAVWQWYRDQSALAFGEY